MSLEIARLRKSFDNKPVIDGLDLACPDQGLVCITGPSGCGKTTLLKIVAGILEPDEGTVTGVSGRSVSMVFAEDVLLPWLDVGENVALVLPDQSSSKVQQALDMVELSDQGGRYPAELSKGMQRRVAIARALAADGDLLILDEPTNSLDQRLAHDIMARIAGGREGRLTICVTHDKALIKEFATESYEATGTPLKLERVG